MSQSMEERAALFIAETPIVSSHLIPRLASLLWEVRREALEEAAVISGAVGTSAGIAIADRIRVRALISSEEVRREL